MSNTQLHGRSYNSRNTVLTDGRAHKIWDCESPLYDSYELASFAHIIERKLLPFSPAHVSEVKTRLLGGYGMVKTLVVWVLIPGDGGFHSSVTAGFCFWEVGSSGLVCLSSVRALTLSDEILKRDEALRRVDRVGRTEMVSAEALRVLSSDEMKLR
ncbi:hypothetical protein F2Q68_00023719 [Brassica cretica]|uniref:Uncharacterized protein n=1 Tax=Brassica cretica TaxID=69181 RepID=A0A8S9I9W8_BRACR|nr:hypothetical protein F2Q68_00023719 [Brassica cretica]